MIVIALAIALAAGVLAFALVLAITDPPGPGLDPDAAWYLGAAESLAHGDGYRMPTAAWAAPRASSPLAHYPPGFSTAVAIPVALGMSPPQGARLVVALSAFVTTAVCVHLAMLAAGIGAGVALALVLFATPMLVFVHLSVLSEPLFLTCLALALLAMVRAARPSGKGWGGNALAGLAGLAAAAAVMVRYAGIAVTGAVALWALRGPGDARARLRRALIAGLPTVLIQGAWMLRTRVLAAREGGEAVRRAGVYGNLGPTLTMGRETLTRWLVPMQEPLRSTPRVALGVLAALVLLVAYAAWRARRHPSEMSHGTAAEVLAACGVLAACYVGVIALSRLFADPGIPLDDRILAPLVLLAELAVVVGGGLVWRATGHAARLALAGALLAWVVGASAVTTDMVRYVVTWGSDLASDTWRRSALLDWARTDARGRAAPLYSNWPSAVYLHLHRPAWKLPPTPDPRTLRAFRDTLRSRHAYLLAFDTQSPDFVNTDTLAARLGLRVVAKVEDGKVMEAR